MISLERTVTRPELERRHQRWRFAALDSWPTERRHSCRPVGSAHPQTHSSPSDTKSGANHVFFGSATGVSLFLGRFDERT